VKDPPFSKLDLISCRNLLIYLDGDLQDRILRTFHYALRPNGILFLGPSEGVTRENKLFDTLDKKHRIFRRHAADIALPELSPSSVADIPHRRAEIPSPPQRREHN
jgi:two-component system, chemotaxis family, CheB/CheR fusion protein